MQKKRSVVREIIRVATVSRRRQKESEQDYLKRIIAAVKVAPDDVAANLSSEAKAWYQAAVQAIEQNSEIPSPTLHLESSELADDVEAMVPSQDAEDTNEEVPITASVVEPSVTTPRELSASDRARRMILENLGKVAKKDLRVLVAEAGISVSNNSFDTIYYETSKTIQIAKEMGIIR